MSQQIINFTKSNFIFSLFNEYVYNEARLNLEWVTRYLKSDFDESNQMYNTLLDIIKTIEYNNLTEAHIEVSLSKLGYSDDEVISIKDKIRSYRGYNLNQSKPLLDQLRHVCYKAYCDRAKYLSNGDEESFVKLCAKFVYRSNDSSALTPVTFDSYNISDLLKIYAKSGLHSRYKFINDSYSMSNSYPAGQIVQVVAAPSTGKSLFLQGEAINFMEQGNSVHYLAMGDLNPLDFIIRMICIRYRIPKREVESNVVAYYNRYKDDFSQLLKITIVPSGVISSGEYVRFVKNTLEDTQVLMIDYDSNFKVSSNLMMYEQGGEVYNDLTELSDLGKLVFIASQPKSAFFRSESIPADSSGESSRKYHISDMVITIGRKPGVNFPMGMFNIGKSRRGEEVYDVPYIRTVEGLFYPCSNFLYAKMAQEKYFSPKTYAMLEGEDLVESLKDESITY